MTSLLLVSALLALPCRAVISNGEGPKGEPGAPIWHEFPAASVIVPSAQAVPALPAVADAQVAGPAAAESSMAGVSAEIAPDLKAARKGGDGDAAAAGESIQNALEGAADAPAAGSLPAVHLKIYSDEAPVRRDPRESALETSGGVAASFRYAYESVKAEAEKKKLGAPRFVEAWRLDGGWQFHFVVGGRYASAYARDGHQPADRAWLQDEWKPESSLGLAPARFSQKVSVTPREAIAEAARALGVAADQTGLSLWTLPKSNSLWFVVDSEDGRRVAINAGSGKRRVLDKSEVTRERVEASARALAGQKGYPFSQTEYNAAYAGYAGMLRQDGATRAQLALFARLAAALPVRGGRFNPWSGD